MRKEQKINALIEDNYKRFRKTRNIYINEQKRMCYIFKTQINVSNCHESNCINLKMDDYVELISKNYKFFLYVDKKSNMNQVNSVLDFYSFIFTHKFSLRANAHKKKNTIYRFSIFKEFLGFDLIKSEARQYREYNPLIHLVA